MNKIITGILGLVVSLSLVAGAAYAAFTTSVNVNGITLGTTTPGLEVKLGNEPDDQYRTTATMEADFQLPAISPGQVSQPGELWLRNSGTIDLNLAAQVTHAEGDWALLSPKMDGIVCQIAVSNNGVCPDSGSGSTGWHSLADWNAAPIALPGSPLLKGAESGAYLANFRLAGDVDNNYAGKSITNLQITITGTQTP